ncbi:hypothetical protein, variant [Exophiala oligosperma]|uniref:Transcription factor domain-containing protein n=1 Tax=Exophiala oligosperma TaxID=215243 RepID=A0A0D2CA31_9EURO|nr:hypothetical protein, variant [Exophiala oligosperma]KIW46712.1 hypothetical protein, variant [Exophiala oligosperma]
MAKTDPEMRKLIRSHCMLGKNRGKILHSRRKPKTVVPISVSRPVQQVLDLEPASSVPNRLGSELSLLRFADSVEPSTLWEVLKYRSMFDPLTYDPAYLNAVMFGAQAYLDLVSGRSSKRSSMQMLKTIQLLRERLSISDENEPESLSNPTILIILTLAHIAHLNGDHITAKRHLEGLCTIVNLRGGIAAFQNTPKLLTELIRCDLSIAIHKGTKPVFDFTQPLQSIKYQLQTKSSPPTVRCLNYESPNVKDKHTHFKTDEKLAELWDTMSNFCYLVNSVAEKNIKLSDQILLNTMGSVMYALLGMNFPTNPINEAIRLGMLAFCSHSFLERRGIHLPNSYLCENYKTCFEDVNTQLQGDPSQVSLWLLMIGKISIFASDTDDSAWIKSKLRENIGTNNGWSWPQLRPSLKSFLWIDILHDAPGKTIFESVS